MSVGSHMVWTPSTAAQDLTGRACSSFAVVEAGVLDTEF